jgi:hypothetical protein
MQRVSSDVTLELEVNMRKKNSTIAAIADAIVNLVDRNGGPVTLLQVSQIPGFSAKLGEPEFEWGTGDDTGNDRRVIWGGMTKSGAEALKEVVLNGRVATCSLTRLDYALQGCLPLARNWVPIGLTPSTTANFTIGTTLISASESVLRELESNPHTAAFAAHRL